MTGPEGEPNQRKRMMQSIQQNFHVPFHYPVYFTADLFSQDNPLLKEVVRHRGIHLPRKMLFIIDEGLYQHHPDLPVSIEAYCRFHQDVLKMAGPPIFMEGGEGAKNHPEYVALLHEAIHEAGLCRHGYIVALGGGAVIDLVGYVAATAHRGIRLIRVPTTVLSQNDSAVGVKNGINAFGKKNFLGTFSPPYAVVNDASFLGTLSERDWRSGMAEAIKVALIKDPLFFAFLEQHAPLLKDRHLSTMQQLIFRSAQLHLQHIAQNGDPFEAGSSRPLDFGHWAAHKLEHLTDFRLRHGEAVAIGIALDTTYSYLAGFLSKPEWKRILALLSGIGLVLYTPEMEDYDTLLTGLEEFREHLGGGLTVMLLKEIGEGFEVHQIDRDILIESVALLAEREVGETDVGIPYHSFK